MVLGGALVVLLIEIAQRQVCVARLAGFPQAESRDQRQSRRGGGCPSYPQTTLFPTGLTGQTTDGYEIPDPIDQEGYSEGEACADLEDWVES